MFATWAVGGAVVLPPVGPVDPVALLDAADRAGVSVLNLPSSLLHAWADALAGPLPWPRTLRLVVVGSEPADPRRLARWLGSRPVGGRRWRTPTACRRRP